MKYKNISNRVLRVKNSLIHQNEIVDLDEYSARLFVKMGLLVICPDIIEEYNEEPVVIESQSVFIKEEVKKEDVADDIPIASESNIEEHPVKKKRVKNENNIHQKAE